MKRYGFILLLVITQVSSVVEFVFDDLNYIPQSTHTEVTAGRLDVNFGGGDGIYTSGDGISIRAIQIDSSGRHIIAGSGWRVERLTADGVLDITFGGGDGIYTSIDGVTIYAMQIDSLGRHIIAGHDGSGWRVERLTTDGVLDTTFGGGDGIYTSGTGLRIHAIQIDSLGRHIIAGYDGSGWRVERLTADGVLDTTYGGGDGIYTSGTGVSIYAMQIDSLGRHIIAGHDGSGWRVERLTTDGVLDTTYGGGDGIYTSGPTGSVIRVMQIDALGRHIIAGYDGSGWRVERLTADGVLDTTFGGGDGIYISGTGFVIHAVQIDALGRHIIAGYDSSTDWRVERLTADGVLDITFGGGDGIYTSGDGLVIYAMQIDSLGRHVIAGYDGPGWRVERLTDDTPPLNLVAVNTGFAR